jgi:hypothetical protein
MQIDARALHLPAFKLQLSPVVATRHARSFFGRRLYAGQLLRESTLPLLTHYQLLKMKAKPI